jgi:hypothetical protein
MLVCFMVEAHKSLLDHLIAMHEQYVTGLLCRSRHAFDERHREFRKRARRGIQTVLSAMEILLERRTDDPLIALYRQIDEAALRAALDDCREFERLEDHGLQDELRARYTGLRRYLPAFLELPFHSEPERSGSWPRSSWRGHSIATMLVICHRTRRTNLFRLAGASRSIETKLKRDARTGDYGSWRWRLPCGRRCAAERSTFRRAAITSPSPI